MKSMPIAAYSVPIWPMLFARLTRLCKFYGFNPQFICCSATIANPGELASTLIGRPVEVIDQSGAASGEKHIVFYNPPVVNKQLGVRKSVLQETLHISSMLVDNDISTIVFGKSRLTVEVLTRHLKERVKDPFGNAGRVRGYRGGYLPTLRREIERGLRKGEIRAVVSTNALELGIDIGQLDACVLCGYPGSIASTWQEAGRAGRRKNTALTIMVASSSALDQYIVNHPEYFFRVRRKTRWYIRIICMCCWGTSNARHMSFRSKRAKATRSAYRRASFLITSAKSTF